MSNENKKQSKLVTLINSYRFVKLIIVVLVVGAVAGVFFLGQRSNLTTESETVQIGFENIGELATQSAYVTVVNVVEDSRELFGVTIPFTTSKYIYSYNVSVKAGYNFSDITWSVDETTKVITVTLPEVEVLSSEIDLDSFVVYLEDESIFDQITLEDNNEAMAELKQNAIDNAVANGLYENAESNAKLILNGYIGQVFDLTEYTIEYVTQ